MSRAALWTAVVVVHSGDDPPGRFLVVADDGYTAKVRALARADEAGLRGRIRTAEVDHVVDLPAGKISSEQMRATAVAVGVDLDDFDSTGLPAFIVC